MDKFCIKFVEVSDLGWSVCLTSNKMNRVLENNGMQFKRKEPHWKNWRWALTDKGKEWSTMVAPHRYKKIYWDTRIIGLLKF